MYFGRARPIARARALKIGDAVFADMPILRQENLDGVKFFLDNPEAKTKPNAAETWLLLRAKSTAGKGIFARVQFIQRLDTVGGQPPQTGCDSAHSGQRTRVAYSAEYYFYSARR